MSQIESAIRAQVKEEFVANSVAVNLSEDVNLIEEGIIDSLGIFIMVEYLQDRFQIQILPEEVVLDNFQTVGAMTRLVSSKLESMERV